MPERESPELAPQPEAGATVACLLGCGWVELAITARAAASFSRSIATCRTRGGIAYA